jgi:hypothetical protein
MKRLLLLSLLSAAPVMAQRVITTESAGELITTAALDGAVVDDVAVLDRATGVLRAGIWNGSTLTWTVTGAGLTGAEWLTAGDVEQSPGNPMTLVMFSSAWQQAETWTPATFHRGVLRGLGFLPTGLALLQAGGSALADPVVASSGIFTNGPELSLFINDGSGQPPLSGSAAPVPVLRRGSRMQSALGEAALFLSDTSLQLWRPSGFVIVKDAELTGLTPASRYAVGRFGLTGESCVVWQPGETQFQHVAQQAGGAFAAPQTWSAGLALGQLLAVVSPGLTSNDWLMAISQDRTEARLFTFTPGSPPVLRQSFTAPPGTSFSTAVPQTGGHFLLLNGSGSQTTGWQRAVFNGTTHNVSANTALPAVRRSAAAPTLFFFSSDPWLEAGAQLLALEDLGDWTTAAGPGGTIFLTDAGTPAGLGSPASGFSSSPGFGQTSQVRADVSLASLGAARSQPRPEVEMSPPPGRYPPVSYTLNPGTPEEAVVTVPLTLTLSFRSGTASGIRWRNNGGAWQLWNAESPPALTADATIEACAVALGSPAGPITRGTYTFGTLPSLTTPPAVDADGNGLSDLWEKTFNIHDPAGDKDGDGASNLAEYNAGTDPCDAASVPGPSVGTPVLTILSVSTGPNPRLFLRLTGTPGVLHSAETSATLSAAAWSPTELPFIMPAVGRYDFSIPITPGQRQFVRGVAGR